MKNMEVRAGDLEFIQDIVKAPCLLDIQADMSDRCFIYVRVVCGKDLLQDVNLRMIAEQIEAEEMAVAERTQPELSEKRS